MANKALKDALRVLLEQTQGTEDCVMDPAAYKAAQQVAEAALTAASAEAATPVAHVIDHDIDESIIDCRLPVGTPLYAAHQASQPIGQPVSDDDALDQVMRERDSYHEIADKLADAIAKHFGEDIGEHSSANCPWTAALEVIENADSQPVSGAGMTEEQIMEVSKRIGPTLFRSGPAEYLGFVRDDLLKFVRTILSASGQAGQSEKGGRDAALEEAKQTVYLQGRQYYGPAWKSASNVLNAAAQAIESLKSTPAQTAPVNVPKAVHLLNEAHEAFFAIKQGHEDYQAIARLMDKKLNEHMSALLAAAPAPAQTQQSEKDAEVVSLLHDMADYIFTPANVTPEIVADGIKFTEAMIGMHQRGIELKQRYDAIAQEKANQKGGA